MTVFGPMIRSESAPLGERFTWPAPSSGDVATKNIGCSLTNELVDSVKASYLRPMVTDRTWRTNVSDR